jgi:hypothetical protein
MQDLLLLRDKQKISYNFYGKVFQKWAIWKIEKDMDTF